jgi:hypothetical protein
MWTLDSPAVQRPSLTGSHIVRVDVSRSLALLQSFDDPRLIRGIPRPDQVGHSFVLQDHATVHVDVPIQAGQPVDDISIRVADLSALSDRPTAPTLIAQLFDKPPSAMRQLPSVTLDQLAAHADWERVAQEIDFTRP